MSLYCVRSFVQESMTWEDAWYLNLFIHLCVQAILFLVPLKNEECLLSMQNLKYAGVTSHIS